MSGAIRVTTDGQGGAQISNPSRPSTPVPTSDTKEVPTAKVGAIRKEVVRVQIGADGQPTETKQSPTGISAQDIAKDAAQGDPMMSARNSYGLTIPPSKLTANDTLDLPGVGRERVAVLETLGMIRKNTSGAYEITGKAATELLADQQKADDAVKDATDPDVPDVGQIPGTTKEVDSFEAAVKDVAAPVYEAATRIMAKTGEVPDAMIAEVAQRTGHEPATIRHHVAEATKQYEAAARATAKNAGVDADAYESFISHIWQADPEKAMEAALAFSQQHDPAPLYRLAKDYAASGKQHLGYSTDEQMSAAAKGNIPARIVDGRVVLALPSGEVTWAEAVRLKLVSVSGKPAR